MLNCHGELPAVQTLAPQGPETIFHHGPGSFATASCLICKRRYPGASIESDVFASRVPLCPHCTPILEAEERERERERDRRREERDRSRKRRKVKEGEWDPEAAEEEEEEDRRREGGGGGIDGMDERNEWEGKAVIKPDIVFFGSVSLKSSLSGASNVGCESSGGGRPSHAPSRRALLRLSDIGGLTHSSGQPSPARLCRTSLTTDSSKTANKSTSSLSWEPHSE